MNKLKDWAHWLFQRYLTPQELCQAAREAQAPNLTQSSAKRQTRYTYTDGPMIYLGQQIVKTMQDAGYPATIIEGFRSADRQTELYERKPRVTKAQAFESPHQFYEAVDIVHPTMHWNAPAEYWGQLQVAVRVVAEKFQVNLEHGHHWRFVDSAHVELADWRNIRERYRDGDEGGAVAPYRYPTSAELAERFREVLPKVWAQRPR